MKKKEGFVTACVIFVLTLLFHSNIMAATQRLEEEKIYRINTENGGQDYRFTPKISGLYRIASYFDEDGYGDPYAEFYGRNGENQWELMKYDDDSGAGLNYQLLVYLSAGKEYKLKDDNYEDEYLHYMRIQYLGDCFESPDAKLLLNEKKNIELKENGKYEFFFKFIAPEDGTYFLNSSNLSYECDVYTFPLTENSLLANEYSQELEDFRREIQLKEGESCGIYLCLDKCDDETVQMGLQMICAADLYLKDAEIIPENKDVFVADNKNNCQAIVYRFEARENASYLLNLDVSECQVYLNLYEVSGRSLRKIDSFTNYEGEEDLYGFQNICHFEAGKSYILAMERVDLWDNEAEDFSFTMRLTNMNVEYLQKAISMKKGEDYTISLDFAGGDTTAFLYRPEESAYYAFQSSGAKDHQSMVLIYSIENGLIQTERLSYKSGVNYLVGRYMEANKEYLILVYHYPWDDGERFENYDYTARIVALENELLSRSINMETGKEYNISVDNGMPSATFLFTPKRKGVYKFMAYACTVMPDLDVYIYDRKNASIEEYPLSQMEEDYDDDWEVDYGKEYEYVSERINNTDLKLLLEEGKTYLFQPDTDEKVESLRIMISKYVPELESYWCSEFHDINGSACLDLQEHYFDEFYEQASENLQDGEAALILRENWDCFWNSLWQALFVEYLQNESEDFLQDDNMLITEDPSEEDNSYSGENLHDGEDAYNRENGFGLLDSWQDFCQDFWTQLVEGPALLNKENYSADKYATIQRLKQAFISRVNVEMMSTDLSKVEKDFQDAFWNSFWIHCKEEIKRDYETLIKQKPIFVWNGSECDVFLDGEKYNDEVIVTSSVLEEASCKQAGIILYTAAITYQEEEIHSYHKELIPISKHTWTYDCLLEEATLEKEGRRQYRCSVCGETYIEMIAKASYDLAETCYVTLSQNTFTENGSERKPAVYVKRQDNDQNLQKGTDFEVNYSNNVDVGLATVTVIGIGDYSGRLTAEYTIRPTGTSLVEVINPSKKNLQITWNINPDVDGYEIKYSTQSNFADASTKVIAGSEIHTYKLTNRTIGKRYYVRVRTYKVVDGQKIYSLWSEYKSAYVVPPVENFRADNLASRTLRADWDACSYQEVEGYDITAYSDEELTKIVKKFDITNLDENYLNWTGRTLGKTYYIRIRSYVTNPFDGEKIYSNWSQVVPVQIVK